MSRRTAKKRSQHGKKTRTVLQKPDNAPGIPKPAADDSDTRQQPKQQQPKQAVRPSSRQRLLIALCVAGVWWFVLAAMALLTANPVTLNREQILRADYLVSGMIADDGSAAIIVEKEWKHQEKLERISVENLTETAGRPGGRYLIPLSKIGRDRFRVTATRLPDRSPLLYPTTDEALSQLYDLLDEMRGPGGR